MRANWVHKLLILILTAVIVLPSEEDGAFDLAFLDVQGGEVHSAFTKRIHKKDAPNQIQSALENQDYGLCLRSRYDFLDLVFSGFFELSRVEIHFYSQKFNAPKTNFSYLLSVLLLNLPPPIV
ncbi:hypothetical protein AB3N59_08175 [Leptospira sp. WS92.C1]